MSELQAVVGIELIRKGGAAGGGGGTGGDKARIEVGDAVFFVFVLIFIFVVVVVVGGVGEKEARGSVW